MVEQKRLPSYIYLPPDVARRQAESGRDGPYGLLRYEVSWKERYEALRTRGYQLRPRYHPEWRPSWTGTNLDPEFCEDAVMLKHFEVMDAVRVSDGFLVAIKTVKKGGQELQIAQFLSSIQGSTNHCVPVFDVLQDPVDASMSLMVMQYLRPWNDPEFTLLGDVVDFVTQMLEGLAFLHNNRVAHRDIAPPNVMMDGRVLYPQGHHPVWRNRSPDAIHDLEPLHRIDHPVKYFYVDFGLSVRFSTGQSTLVVGDVGRDASVPELSRTVPYDAFKADIYALGTFFDKEFAQTYRYTEFLRPIINSMKQREPGLRPTANALVDAFEGIRETVNPADLRWRLAPKSEPVYERIFNDTVAVTRNSLSQLRRFVQSE
ncbi:kinase-like protein [Trametes coccinea BRFM310]|uniref:non-specific serine/threonine protein kinase n=1 Tax=Trametes coccinea (strain BRFM310) TaxID=1353009 RepID=A0A1Y2IA11_TRAC3|nr:kinase-like protein [Trametes coccinea BRFM310]